MIDALKAIKKLRKPPALHNWVRNIRPRTDDTAQSLYNTAINFPLHSLKPVIDIIRNVVVDGITDEMAFKSVEKIGNVRTRSYAKQILKAFLPHARKKRFKGVQIFKDTIEFYPVAQNVMVPVKPTFVTNENGKLVVHFVICWAEIGLSDYQRRVLSTIIHDSIMTLEDFQSCEVIITCVPRYAGSKTERFVTNWTINDYPLLSESERRDLFVRYGRALEQAERMIFEALS